jgi:hypothetical protein
MSTPQLGMDVAEACADALLAACAQALILQTATTGSTENITIVQARDLARDTLDTVIRRTFQEGPKPR